MVKPRAREAGEGVDDTADTGCIVQHDEGVNRVMVHLLTRLYDLRIFADRFRTTRHNLAHTRPEELCS